MSDDWFGSRYDDTLIGRIYDAMVDDDEDPAKSSHRIIDAYEEADEKGKDLLDDVFTSLCGWRLKTLIAEQGGA